MLIECLVRQKTTTRARNCKNNKPFKDNIILSVAVPTLWVDYNDILAVAVPTLWVDYNEQDPREQQLPRNLEN